MGALSRDYAAQADGTLAKLRDASVSGPEQVAAWKEIEAGLEHLDPFWSPCMSRRRPSGGGSTLSVISCRKARVLTKRSSALPL